MPSISQFSFKCTNSKCTEFTLSKNIQIFKKFCPYPRRPTRRKERLQFRGKQYTGDIFPGQHVPSSKFLSFWIAATERTTTSAILTVYHDFWVPLQNSICNVNHRTCTQLFVVIWREWSISHIVQVISHIVQVILHFIIEKLTIHVLKTYYNMVPFYNNNHIVHKKVKIVFKKWKEKF